MRIAEMITKDENVLMFRASFKARPLKSNRCRHQDRASLNLVPNGRVTLIQQNRKRGLVHVCVPLDKGNAGCGSKIEPVLNVEAGSRGLVVRESILLSPRSPQ